MQRLHVTQTTRTLCQLTGPYGEAAEPSLCFKCQDSVASQKLKLDSVYLVQQARLRCSQQCHYRQCCMHLPEVELLAFQNRKIAMLINASVPNVNMLFMSDSQ